MFGFTHKKIEKCLVSLSYSSPYKRCPNPPLNLYHIFNNKFTKKMYKKMTSNTSIYNFGDWLFYFSVILI